MDGLSAAASGIAVASVALRLAGSVKQVYEFWNSVKEAPDEIRAITEDLRILSSVLARKANEAQHIEPEASLEAALSGCLLHVKILNGLINEIEPGFDSTRSRVRKWTAFKAILKRGQLVRFQEALERMKSTLHIVLHVHDSFLTRNLYISQNRELKNMIQSSSSLNILGHPNIVSDARSNRVALSAHDQNATSLYAREEKSIQRSHQASDGFRQRQVWCGRTLSCERCVTDFWLFTIYARMRTKLQFFGKAGDPRSECELDQYECETTYIISPAQWLIRLGFQYGLRHRWSSSSTQGWKNTLETTRPVPDEALIFDFCKMGNLPAIQKLLSGGHASVRDTDSRGWTPLHFAAANFHSELCKFLQEAGADPNALTLQRRVWHRSKTPVELAADSIYGTTYAVFSQVLMTLRFLTDSMDLSDEAVYGWRVLTRLCWCAVEGNGEATAKTALLLCVFKSLSFELKTYVFRCQLARMLSYIHFASSCDQEEAHDFLVEVGGKAIIDMPIDEKDGFHILHMNAIDDKIYRVDEERPCLIILKGASLYPLGFDERYTPAWETPTSLAMYSQWTFANLQNALKSIKIDLDEYVQEELVRNGIVHPGWTKETLLYLLSHNQEPKSFNEDRRYCSDCAQRIRGVSVQPYWRYRLELIKLGQYPGIAAQNYHEANQTEYTNFENSTNVSDTLNEDTCSIEDGAVDCLSEPSSRSAASELEPEMEPEMEVEANPHEYPRSVSLLADCVYAWEETICMDCWLHYMRTGTRRQPGPWRREYESNWSSAESIMAEDEFTEDESSEDEASEDEFSPYLIHT